MKRGVVEEVRKFVEEECKKPYNQYTYEVYTYHIEPVVRRAKEMAFKLGIDLELIELAALLHDIGLVRYGRDNHHITSADIAERKLNELEYPPEKIEIIKRCILTHRGSQANLREGVEEQIIADADAMAHFDTIGGLFKVNFLIQKDKGQGEITKFIREKYINSYQKLSKEAKEIIKPKYEAAMLLLT